MSAEDYMPADWDGDGDSFWPYLRRAPRPVIPRPKCYRCGVSCFWAQTNGRWHIAGRNGPHICGEGEDPRDSFTAVT